MHGKKGLNGDGRLLRWFLVPLLPKPLIKSRTRYQKKGFYMVKCPNCNSSNVRERNIGKKTGGVAGGVGGALGGAATGAAIGSVIPGVGTAIGGVVGGLLGRFAAAAAGATAGAAAGSALDGIVFDKYECRDCETTFD